MRNNFKVSMAGCKLTVALLVAFALVGGAVFAGGKKEAGVAIQMATKPMTEQFILASMMQTLIQQDTDLTVELTEGVGGLFHRHGGAGGEKAQELIDESADLRGLHCFGNPLDSIDRFFWRFL